MRITDNTPAKKNGKSFRATKFYSRDEAEAGGGSHTGTKDHKETVSRFTTAVTLLCGRDVLIFKDNFRVCFQIHNQAGIFPSQTFASKAGKGSEKQKEGSRHGRGLKLKGFGVLLKANTKHIFPDFSRFSKKYFSIIGC